MSLPHLTSRRTSTSMRRAARLSALAVVLGAAVSTAAAQPSGRGGPGDEEGSSWGLGLAVISSQSPYRGVDRETKALPMIRFENEYVKVGGPGLEIKLPGLDLGDAGRVKFGLVGKMEFAGYEASDSPFLAGMAERKSGFWGGAKAEWDNEVAEISLQWIADTSGHSKGQRFSLGVEKNWRFGNRLMLVPHLTAHWLDRKYVDYYYGVRAAEATAGRAAYAGKSGVDVELGLRTMYLFDRHHSLMLDVSATRLASSIKDSPLVDRSSSNRVMLGYLYSF